MRRSFLLILPLSLLTTASAAQVGHPPKSSPYRDIVNGMSVGPVVSLYGGDGGKLGIGPHDGVMFGARFDIRLGGVVGAELGLHHGSLDRLIVDADAPVATRVTGPVSQSVSIAEIGLKFNITGRKSWHRLAPYFGGFGGLAFAGKTAADTSGYEFGTKAMLGPVLGVRVILSDRFHARVEIRRSFWKLNYPADYLDEPSQDPGITESNAVLPDGGLEEWTSANWIMFGISYSF